MRTKTITSILLVALCLPAFPAWAQPSDKSQVSEERPISDFIDVAAEGHQMDPDIATDGERSFAVWTDTRQGESEVYGSLLVDGAASKVVGFDISDSDGWSGSPSIAFTRGRYLVAWKHLTEEAARIRAAVIDTSGRVLRSGIPIGSTEVTGDLPTDDLGPHVAVAGNEHGSLVAFRDADGHVSAQRLDRDGTPVGDVIEIYDEPTPIFGIDASASGDMFTVAFTTCDEDCRFGARAARVTAMGKVLDPDGLPLAEEAAAPGRISTAWDGQRFGVVWTANNGGIRASSFTPDQRPGSGNVTAVPGSVGNTPDITATSLGFLLVFRDAGRLVTSNFEPGTGTATPPVTVAEGLTGWNPSLVAIGGRVTNLWSASGGDFLDVYSQALSQEGVPLSTPSALAQSAFGQIHPSIAPGDAAYLALWQDYRAHSGPMIYAARLAPSGEPVDGQGFQISRENGRHPIASWNGSSWLVVWRQNERRREQLLVGSRVGADGTVMDPIPMPISVSLRRFDEVEVASDGTDWVVAFGDKNDGSVKTVHVSAAGIPSAEAYVVDRRGEQPSIAFHDDRYVMVWSRNGDVRGAFLSDRGELLDAPRKITTNDAYDLQPSVASSGQHAFISWTRFNKDREPPDIHGLVIQSSFDDGTVSALNADERSDSEPISVWDGGRFAVLWRACAAACVRPDASMRFVDVHGTATSPVSRVATANVLGAPAFSAASLGDSSFVVVYRKVEGPASATGVPRGYLRTVRRI